MQSHTLNQTICLTQWYNHSDLQNTDNGARQGSVLGSLLFLFDVNGIKEAIRSDQSVVTPGVSCHSNYGRQQRRHRKDTTVPCRAKLYAVKIIKESLQS